MTVLFFQCLYLLGLVIYSPQEIDPAYRNIDSLEAQLKILKDQDSIVQLHLQLGKQYKLIGRHDTSIQHLEAAQQYYHQRGDSLARADLIVAIGEVHRHNDVPDQAMSNFLKGLKAYERMGRLDRMAAVYNSMANVVMRQNDYGKAMGFANKVDTLLKQQPTPAVRAQWLTNRGRIFNNHRQFDSAVYYHSLALNVFDSLGMFHAKGRAMHNKANSLRELGRYEEALDLCQSVLAIPEIKENVKSHIFTLLLLADILNSLGEYESAIGYAQQGLRLAMTYRFLDRHRVALLYLSQIYESMAQYDSAYKYHKAYAELMNVIFDKDRYEQVNRLNTLYETEKKEQTIELQKSRQQLLYFGIGFSLLLGVVISAAYVVRTRDNRLLTEQNAQIEKQNNEREVLLKEIHHRVKNNLQVISSLLSMQSRKMEDSEAKTAVKEGQSRIKSMSLIHQKLYGEGNLSRINMKEYISDLSNFLFNSYKPGDEIEQIIEAEEILLDVDTAVPLGLIINELISNALKYAFDPGQRGEISIKLNHQVNTYQLQIADTGKGLPEGYDQKQSMGMRLVHILTDQLNGKLQIDQSNGTLFTIFFDDKRAA